MTKSSKVTVSSACTQKSLILCLSFSQKKKKLFSSNPSIWPNIGKRTFVSCVVMFRCDNLVKFC